MCGRFAYRGEEWPELVADLDKPSFQPNFNIAPNDLAPIIHLQKDNLDITSMRWGLRPSWSKKSTMEPINARIETIESKPMFKEAYEQRRCIVPADGWYEWMTTPRGKVPFFHKAKDASVLLMAGIYEQWCGDGDELKTFSILTQDSSLDVSHVHNRMPVLIESSKINHWLTGKETPLSNPQIEVYPVGREVNKTSANGPQLIQKLRTLFD